MEGKKDSPPLDNLSQDNIRPLAVVSQLMQSTANMSHIDELFLWITSTVVQQLNMNAAQLWATQALTNGHSRTELRASTNRNAAQTQPLYENTTVAEFIERMLQQQQGMLSVPLTSIFSPYQANIFAQYGSQYWTVYFISRDVLLPPTKKGQQTASTPLRVVLSLFSQQPVEQTSVRAISFILEQSLRIALTRKLLSPATQLPVTPRPESLGEIPPLAHLIPEHTQQPVVEQANNPFSNAVVITERKARQLYTFIDGKKSVAELTQLLHFSQKEISEALQFLLAQKHITLRRPEEKPAP